MPDLSHITQWPPQPSTVTGIGLLVGAAAAMAVQPELAVIIVPLIAGIFHVAIPDSTSTGAGNA